MDNRTIIQRSIDYIEDNLQANITAEELAKQAGFSLFHFYRIFQSVTGMSVMQYILHRRLLHGIYSISRGSTKVDAALQYGFDTYAGFYKAFCREFGCPPSEYLCSCPYVMLANQFVCVAWFSTYEKYHELFGRNVEMTHWLIDRMEELKEI